MDLENGDTLYIEATIKGSVRLTLYKAGSQTGASTRLTTEEARTMARALLAAADEAESHREIR